MEKPLRYTDVVIDLETVTTDVTVPDAIIQLGLCMFRRDAQLPMISFNLYVKHDVFAEDKTTLYWWQEHNPEYFNFMIDYPERITTQEMLFRLTAIIKEYCVDKPSMWGNGVSFDNAMLANNYKRYELDQPWTFREDRCYRTIIAESGIVTKRNAADSLVSGGEPPPNWFAHNAEYDAVNEAINLIAAIQERYEDEQAEGEGARRH